MKKIIKIFLIIGWMSNLFLGIAFALGGELPRWWIAFMLIICPIIVLGEVTLNN